MLPSDGFDIGVWGFGCGKVYVIGAQGVRAAGQEGSSYGWDGMMLSGLFL